MTTIYGNNMENTHKLDKKAYECVFFFDKSESRSPDYLTKS